MSRSSLAFLPALIGLLFAAAAFADPPSIGPSGPIEFGRATFNDTYCDVPFFSGDCGSGCETGGNCARCGIGGGSNCGCGSLSNCNGSSDYVTRRLFPSWSDTTLTGWIDAGIMGNSLSPVTHFNGPVTFADQDRGQLNQFYGVLKRAPADLSQNRGFYLGGEVDFFFGSDSFFTTASGLDGTQAGNVPQWNTDRNFGYGFSMPQMYVETDYNNLRVKWGHFYSILGYEVVPSIGNFFYSHSYALQYGQPLTHTGMLASSKLGDNWSWNAGLVSSWNDFSLRNGAQFLGGLTYTHEDYGSLAFAMVTGNESDINSPGIRPDSNRSTYSVVGTMNLSDNLTYVIHHSLGVQQNTLGFNALDTKQAAWYGIAQYLFYKLNHSWTVGARAEWFEDPQGYLVTGLRPGNTDARYRFPGSFYETSLGLNYKPTGNFTLRGEIRHDWYAGPGGFTSPGVPGGSPNQPFGDNSSGNQFLFGVDAIYQF